MPKPLNAKYTNKMNKAVMTKQDKNPENINAFIFGPLRLPHSSLLSLVTVFSCPQWGHGLKNVRLSFFLPLTIVICDENCASLKSISTCCPHDLHCISTFFASTLHTTPIQRMLLFYRKKAVIVYLHILFILMHHVRAQLSL